MPGTIYQFEVLAQAIETLKGRGDARGQIMEQNPEYAYLGAMGPDLLMYTFIDDADLRRQMAEVMDGTVDINDLSNTDKLTIHRNLLMVTYETVFSRFSDLWPVLQDLHNVFDAMQAAIEDEDRDALEEAADQVEDIQSRLAPLTGAGTSGFDAYAAINQLISLFRPNIQAESTTANAFQTQPFTWRLYEFLRWRGGGKMARKLLELAQNERDSERREKKLAFAYGWMSHVAAATTGEPFINNIVGGPYRTHWWRNRLIRNYVDSWTWGWFHTSGVSMAGDIPSPDYPDWEDPCAANLHNRIRVEGAPTGERAVQAVIDGITPPDALPDFIADMLSEAVRDTYASGWKPLSLDVDVFSAQTFNNAYVGAISVLYFMTGGMPPMCSSPPGSPPSDCTSPPDWVDSGGAPPETSPDDFVDSDKKATKIVLAILAVLFFLGGALAAGTAAAVGSAKTDPVRWDDLRCHIYWLRYFLYQMEKSMRDMLVWGTLIYPSTEDLNTSVTEEPPDGPPIATAYCKSRGDQDRYPTQMTSDEAATFTNYPSSLLEMPGTRSWPRSGDYPSVPLAGGAFTPVTRDMTINDPANFPTKTAGGDVAWFGNSVINAVAVITSDALGLVDYNLDADRGYGWMVWSHAVGTFPSEPPIDSEPV